MSRSSAQIAKALVAGLLSLLLAACSSGSPPRPHPSPYTANIALHTAPAVQQQAAHNAGLTALAAASKLVGTPYRYGGTDPQGFDCSGLVQYSYRQAGVRLPRTSRDIFRNSQLIEPSRKQPGDLVFFAISKGKVSHVGIYSGDNRFIHSPSSGKGVGYASLDNPYWGQRLVGVGRI